MRRLVGSCNHIAQYDLRDFKGRIFFVTDVHGHYDLLYKALRDVAFKIDTDILFSGGDWTDRGPDSAHVLDWLHCPWVHSVRGNHEQLLIGAVDEDWKGRNTNCLLTNGGTWVVGLPDHQIQSIYDSFKSLPLAMELYLPRGRKIGIVHAEVPYNDWDKFKEIDPDELAYDGQATAQWSRVWYNRAYSGQVSGVDFVLVGHTPTDSGNVEQHGNMVFADGGSFFRDKVNLIEINDTFMRNIK